MDEKGEKGFVVKDRRKISLDDLNGAQEKEADKAPEESPKREKTTAQEQPFSGEQKRVPFPEVSFSTFVFSLSSSALVHLGEIPDPSTNQPRTDLQMAKQIIDTLGMLEEKTKGNLDQDEAKLLQTVLYDLRMRYVQKSGS